MRHLIPFASAALAVALAACSMLPPPAKPTAAAAKLTGYLAAADLNGAALLGPPPAPESLRGQADRAYYLETRALVGSARWAQAIAENDLWSGGALRAYACAAGVEIVAARTPALVRLLHRVELDGRTIGTPAKNHYNRPRPMIGDSLAICLPREDWMRTNASYPSGHAMVGWSWGLILAELAPAKADGLLAVGRSVGDSRVICGVHYQSDVEAGRTLGAAMVAAMHGDPEFQADIAAARKEIAKAPPLDC